MILLDTHVWIWFLSNPEMLSKTAGEAIQKAVEINGVNISSISVWELAILVKKKRLVLTTSAKEWISTSEKLPFLNFLPVDNAIAFQSVHLPDGLHDDPADRIITASAMTLCLPLITKDKKNFIVSLH